jgi:predicted nucleic acid-binding protein
MNARGCVVDASVAVKWLLPEELAEQARALQRDYEAAPIFAPPLLRAEVANALYQQQRRGLLMSQQLIASLGRLERMGIVLTDHETLYPQACELAAERRFHAIYDGVYVALARRLDLLLWTADERLLMALGPTAPWVRWIGDYSRT